MLSSVEALKKFFYRKKSENKQNNKMSEYVSDPVTELMNCDQRIIYDSSYERTKFGYAITSERGHTSLYNIYKINTLLSNIAAMDTMVLTIPITISCYLADDRPTTPAGTPEIFTNALWADMGVMNAIYQLDIKLAGQSVGKAENIKLRNLKSTAVDNKFDDDEYSVIGKWGVPKTQSYTYTTDAAKEVYPQGGNPAWIANDKTWRDSFLVLLMSLDAKINGDYEAVTLPSTDGLEHTMRKYTTTVNLALPLKYINRAFRSNARLPANLPIHIELTSFKKERPFGVIPFNGGYLTTYVAGDPKFVYAYDEVKQSIKSLINEFRLSSHMSYTNDLLEEFTFNGSKTRSLQANVSVQQQLPTEFIIRVYSEVGYTDNAESKNSEDLVVPYFVGNLIAWFPDSLVNMATDGTTDGRPNGLIDNTSNKLKNLRFKNSGQAIYDIPLEDDQRNGNFNPSAYDYILMTMSKSSYLNVGNNLTNQKGPSNFLSSKMINAGFTFIYMPGGQVNLGVQPGDTSSFNIVIEFDMEKELASGISLSILKKIPSMLMIGPENNVRELMWPQIEQDNVITVIQPKMAN